MALSDDVGESPTENELAAGVLRWWIEHRRVLAGRLHDGCQQDLSILALEIGRLSRSLDHSDTAVAALKDLAAQATRVQEELRAVTIDLFPPALITKGLVEALHTESRRHDFPVEVVAERELSLPAQREAAIFFFCRAVLNAAASRCERGVVLTLSGGRDVTCVKVELRTGSDVATDIHDSVQPLAAAAGGSCVLSLESIPLVVASWPAS